MPLPVVCENGDFDFSEEYNLQYIHGQTEPSLLDRDEIRLFCPMCQREKRISLKEDGVFWDEKLQILSHWKDDSRTAQLGGGYFKPNGDYVRRIGEEFSIIIPGGFINRLDVKGICYPFIPVFETLNPQTQQKEKLIPRLPVRQEYLDQIEMSGTTKPWIRDGVYTIYLKLVGVDAARPVNLPILKAKQSTPEGEIEVTTLPGVNCVLWPNVSYQEWKRYFLRFGVDQANEVLLENSQRKVRVFAFGQLRFQEEEWVEIKNLEPTRHKVGVFNSRPRWLAIEFHNPKGGIDGGGIWEIPSASNEKYTIDTTTLALDFGTSNTCIAVREGDETRMVSIESCDYYLIHGSEVEPSSQFPDTWFPQRGYGVMRALLPTELLTSKPVNELIIQQSQIYKWQPVINYGFPHKEITDEQALNNLITQFKWRSRVPSQLRDITFELQGRYLELFLLVALAQLVKARKISKQVNLRYSYPLAFDAQQIQNYEQVLNTVAQRTARATGLNITLGKGLDEALAAASAIKPVDYQAALYVDIGGGSSDIALETIRLERRKERHLFHYITSYMYAGTTLSKAFFIGDCLTTNINYFQHEVREANCFQDLLDQGRAVQQDKTERARTITHYFYGYLLESLARHIAAHIISNDWKVGANDPESNYISEANGERTYKIYLYPLGNGWRFGELIDEDFPRSIFSEQLRSRTNQILDEARTYTGQEQSQNWPIIHLEVPSGIEVIKDPKSAVVFGLLKNSSEVGEKKRYYPPDSRPDMKWQSFRTIVGCTTKVGKETVEWHCEVTDRNALPPRLHLPELPEATLDCPETAWPKWPMADAQSSFELKSPHQLDPKNLNKIRADLSICIEKQKKWLKKSPLGIFMEKLFTIKLGTSEVFSDD